jgi:hypothetical protein
LELVLNELSGYVTVSRSLFDDGNGGALQTYLVGRQASIDEWRGTCLLES